MDKSAIYGKFFCGKAGFIAKEYFPDFCNYRRQGYDYDALYDEGFMKRSDKEIVDYLSRSGPILTSQMKKELGFGKDGKKGFDSIITRLQMQTYIGVTEFLIIIPIIYQNVLEGLRAENREMQEVATVFQLPWRKRFRYIELPKIRPFLLSACRVTTGMAWKAGIAAEIIGVPNGSIGKMLYTAKIYLDTDDLLAWTVIIVVISVVAEKVFLAGLSRLLNPCSRFMEDTDAGH